MRFVGSVIIEVDIGFVVFYSTYLRYFLMVEVAIVVTGKERSEGYNKKLKSSERVGNRCISNQTRISEF